MPHTSRIAGMDADYDGDMASANVAYTDEAVAEINDYMNSAVAYINPKGGLRASPLVDTVTRVLINATGD